MNVSSEASNSSSSPGGRSECYAGMRNLESQNNVESRRMAENVRRVLEDRSEGEEERKEE